MTEKHTPEPTVTVTVVGKGTADTEVEVSGQLGKPLHIDGGVTSISTITLRSGQTR